MRSWLVLPLVSMVVLSAELSYAAPTPAVPTDYTVQEGDTCGALAQRFYGDSRRVDLIHAANPTWGAPPHVLKPGDVIKLSPRPARALPPDPKAAPATLGHPRGSVQVDSGSAHPGQAAESLAQGTKVTTGATSSAELVYADETRVRLGASSAAIVGAPKNAVKGSPAGDTVLVSGEARARMGDVTGRRPLAISTDGVRVLVRGEAKVSIDAGVTRVAAYASSSQLTSKNRTAEVRPNFGVMAQAGKPPGKPKPLPPAPMFGAAPPAVVFASVQGVAEITGSYGPGSGPGDMPSSFRVQLSHDADFGDLLSDSVVKDTGLDVKDLPPGTYFVRVSAIDAELFEGPFSPTQRVIVGDIKITPKGKRRATVEVSPAGAYCGVGGGPLAPTAGAFEIDTVRATSVRCAITADGTVTTRDVAGSKLGARIVEAKVTHQPGVWDEGELRIVLTDSDGAPIDGVPVTPVPAGDASIGVFVPAGTPGAYKAPARWKHGAAELAFTAHVGDEDAPSPKVKLDVAPADSPSEPHPTGPEPAATKAAVEIHVDGGGAFENRNLEQKGMRGRVGAGYSLRLGPGILSLGLDGGLEGFLREEFPANDTSGNAAGRVAVGQLHAFSLGLPLQYRYGTYESFFRPYIGATPEALFQSASYSHVVGDKIASSVDQGSAKVLGITGLIGAEVKAGPGAVFIEGGYRGTTVASRDTASVNMHGITTGLGYRLIIGL